jgi:hypothetical protein
VILDSLPDFQEEDVPMAKASQRVGQLKKTYREVHRKMNPDLKTAHICASEVMTEGEKEKIREERNSLMRTRRKNIRSSRQALEMPSGTLDLNSERKAAVKRLEDDIELALRRLYEFFPFPNLQFETSLGGETYEVRVTSTNRR